jgi:hypothetical protein
MSSVKREGDEAVIRLPMSEVHALRVALEPCPCKASKSKSTQDIRARLCGALGRIEAKGGQQWRA